MVPAVYIFGDSTADAGNNNHLNSFAKADQWPYGIDFNNVTGRFSNGKTGVDFIAQYLGLPLAPPYLNLSDSQRARITTGINYASGACGILESTRAGDCLSLSKQVKYFSSTARKDLVKALKSRNKVMKHLRKSIFLFSIGYNEYIAQVRGQETKNLTPPQLADTLINHMIKHIKISFL
ncbi:zeta-carotene desaturase [Senna tora]|uniref:Zeta-carotene desaturase n=1 Tax=Senna tora TaxID=362788 RepID=A0A835CG86_9FABA|nr:zeta-carotene desaturase [Senna tora]